MKKISLLFALFALLSFAFVGCETTTDPDPATQTGTLTLTSSPVGAQIWRDGVNTQKVTPDSLTGLTAGNYSITLKLQGFRDSTFSVTVVAGQRVLRNINLTQNPLVTERFTNVRLFEREATGFSGLRLSDGRLQSSNDATTDIFLDGTGNGPLDLKSQHLRTPAPTTLRYTDFFNGNGTGATNIDDGVDSPVYSSAPAAGWTTSKLFTTRSTYSFLYTDDLYYVKLMVTNNGGGTGPGDPFRWVDVTYIFNKTLNDRRF